MAQPLTPRRVQSPSPKKPRRSMNNSPQFSPLELIPEDDTFQDARLDISGYSRRGSVADGVTSISQLHTQYHIMVKMLPVWILLLPSLLRLLFPGKIELWGFQIGDDKNHPSIIVVDLFSILLICWMLKFLLDWPWNWFVQISELESKFEDDKCQGLKTLKKQKFVALLLCVCTPFLCGAILSFARHYIVLIGANEENNVIFSDLNIGIFVSCGVIRVIIQLSEQIQKSTALIENITENRMVFEMNEELIIQEDQLTPLVTQLNDLQADFQNLQQKFDTFYNKNKFLIDNEQAFLSIHHYKVLEKEIKELNNKLHTKSMDLQDFMGSVIPPPQTQESLHGAPLGFDGGNMKQLFNANGQEMDEETLKQLEKLHEAAHGNGYMKLDLTVGLPLVKFALGLPFVVQRVFWKIVSFIPSQVLRVGYLVLLQVLDSLVEMYHQKNEKKRKIEEVYEDEVAMN